MACPQTLLIEYASGQPDYNVCACMMILLQEKKCLIKLLLKMLGTLACS